MDPLVVVLFLIGSLLVFIGRAQPQIAVGIPNGFSWAWLLTFEPLLALGPWFGILAVERFGRVGFGPLGLTTGVGWLVVGLVCAVVGRLVTLQAIVIADRPNPTLESSSPMPSGVRPEVVRFLSQVSEIDVDAVVARNDDACARRKRALAEG